MKKIIKRIRKSVYSPAKYAIFVGVKIGKNCRIRTKEFGSEPYLIVIGDNTVVAANVKFYNHGAAAILRHIDPNADFFGKINIGSNVYIGSNCLIMPGVSIGDNAIVAAGSVVTKSIEGGKIVGGNPAKVIGTRENFIERNLPFNLGIKNLSEKDKREFLLSLDDDKFIKK